MPRRLLGILTFLLVSVLMSRAQGDIVLLQIGDTSVTKSEFEYYFNRSSVDDPREYLQLFVDYQLKVLYARELGLDTFPDFIAQRKYYLQTLEERTREKDGIGSGIGRQMDEWIKVRHVSEYLKQRADKATIQKAQCRLDSVFSLLRADSVARKTDGESLWIPKRFLLGEWMHELDKLEKNEISAPFSSPLGWHIVWWEDRRQIAKQVKGNVSRVTSGELALKKKEIDEALLVVALDKQELQSYTEQELASFFTEHRAEYRFELPHYKGAVLHCKDKKTAKALKRQLKRCDFRLWEEVVRKTDVYQSGGCRMECGLFQIGKNKYVDKLVFKCGGFEPLEEYPYTFVVGKKMKEPESCLDVREEVVEDYLQWREKQQNDVLKQKYKVEIKEEVLKTVNNSRYN